MKRATVLFFTLSVLILFSSHKYGPAPTTKPYNVLFIFVDDLRPDLGCYGNRIIKSPNIDALAAQSVLFKQQFVTVPTCGASRASILTGLRPRSVNDLSNEAFELKPKSQNIPESFIALLRQQGYYTVGIGKISHSPDGYVYKYLEPKSSQMELERSWDEMLFNAGKWKTGWNAFFGYADGSNRNELKGEVKPYEHAPVSDSSYPDGLTAEMAVSKLKELSTKEKPFFLGVGLFKPHLPFTAPQKYWDLYQEADISLTPSPDIPVGVNPVSLQESGEFNGYKKGEEKASLAKPVSDAYARKLRHAYYAAVSYSDAQIGKILDELKRSGKDKNTIVVLWGDHGWHLGDDRVWGKHTLSEWALHSPLIIKVPGLPQAINNNVVSAVDVYPTLMELCGIKKPAHIDGTSLVPALKNPLASSAGDIAYSYFKKGISLRTDRYRLTKYFRAAMPAIELYDHQTDPYENKNIAAQQPELVKQLMVLLEKGNTGLYNKPVN
ncbi:arylsulfatase A-like enzyme [Pedobacter sp. AK017]|uniref:sulfatase n=1 Tax=Pedobacter sp. AK017 TaxID=2723073 RepID=UPI001609C6B1|nr:sulfatase [Pedobacter sp. AK017]MBB5437693.1 arylsulfatase A-like enzyme [Pedobacter sp. AK017]